MQRAGIEGALALWSGQGVTTVSLVEGGAAGGAEGGAEGAPPVAAIELRFEAAARAFHGLYDDEHGVVYINSGISDEHPLAIVIAHELGHAFGLPHIEKGERSSLMNPGNFVTPPNGADRAALEALWGRCEPAPR